MRVTSLKLYRVCTGLFICNYEAEASALGLIGTYRAYHSCRKGHVLLDQGADGECCPCCNVGGASLQDTCAEEAVLLCSESERRRVNAEIRRPEIEPLLAAAVPKSAQ